MQKVALSLSACYAGKMVDFLVAAEMQNTNAETEKQEISAYFQPQQMLYYFFVVVVAFLLCVWLFFAIELNVGKNSLSLCATHCPSNPLMFHPLSRSLSGWMSNMKVELHDDGNDDDNMRLMIVRALRFFLSLMFDPSCDYCVQSYIMPMFS